MAAKLTAKQEKQQVGYLITCAICLDYFDDPRILPCSHTYCLRCIQKTASSNGGQFECPLRDGTKIEKDHIESLPINRAIIDIVDVLPKMLDTNDPNRKTSPPQCSECLSAVSDLWCIDCPASYCVQCCTDIHKGRKLSEHQRVSIDKKQAESKRCDKHRDERLKYWCDCEALICMDCRDSKQHKDHTSALIVDVVANITEKLRAEFKDAQTSLSQAMIFKSGNVNANMQSITQIFTALRKMIAKYEAVLKNQVQAIEEKNMASIVNHLGLLSNKQLTLSKHNRDFEKILSTNDHTPILEGKRRWTDYLEQFTKELRELKPPIITEYCIEGADHLQASIEHILNQVRVVEQKLGNSNTDVIIPKFL